jgi:hypothetical protein
MFSVAAELVNRPCPWWEEDIMSSGLRRAATVLAICSAAAGCGQASKAERSIELAVLEDKIRGGWAGQMIGVGFGYPTEVKYLGRIIPEEELPEWEPEMVKGTLDQDDLYVDMTFAAVLDEKGLDATTDDFGAMFRDAQYRLWHANLAARRALKRGVPATLSGTPKYNAHANDIDFQIEADFIGLMAPGMLQATNDLGLRAGRVMNSGDGINGGLFVSAMYAAAFFESDPRRLVEAGVAVLPPESEYARLISDVLEWSLQHPDDWTAVWQLIQDTWDGGEPCPHGALDPFNIDAKINGAYVAIGLLYGGGDFEDTMVISTRCGQDSDCNPASAVGVLGVVLGYQGIPEKYRGGIPAIADETFSYTDYSFNTIVESTMQRAIAMAERHGGRVDGDRLIVMTQDAVPAELEMWDDFGSPVELIWIDDQQWSTKGAWEKDSYQKDHWDFRWATSGDAGAEASIRFSGSGVILGGMYLPTGGMADVYLDGELHRTVDVNSDEDSAKVNESVWHAFGLEDGEHELRIVVRGEPYRGPDNVEREGTEVALSYLKVFR